MASDIFWFLPTSGDTRHLGRAESGRTATPDYIRQIAVASDTLGYDGLLIPTGASCLDPWVVATIASEATRRIRLLVALRTSIDNPVSSARQAAALDIASGGRLLLNVVPGGDPVELAADGVFLDHDARYRRTDEFLTIWKRVLAGEIVDFEGEHLRVKGAQTFFEPVQQPHPPLYFGGSSPAAHDIAARQVDTYLTWGEPPEGVGEKIADMRQRAQVLGRTLRFGVRLHVIVRETAEAAWAAAADLIHHLDDETVEAAQRNFSRMDSVGQQRMARLHDGDRSRLEISPNLWAGVGLVRGGAGTALVGDPDTIVERMAEYEALGVDCFVLSGYPHLEEAYRFAELVFPRLGRAGLTTGRQSFTGGAFDARAQR